MNVVIPMAGRGSRFEEAGYTSPKPLISVNGEPMITKALSSLDIEGNYHFVIRKDGNSNNIREAVLSIKPNAKFIEIDYITEGPASSVLLFEKEINNSEELVVANCDQIMWWNSAMFLRNARSEEFDGTIVTYWSETPKNSYAKLDKRGFVTEIREKRVISNVSLNGIHYWKHGSLFVDSATQMIRCDDRAPNREFYVSQTYNHLIQSGRRVGIYHIPNEQHHAVGTPEDLARFVELERNF